MRFRCWAGCCVWTSFFNECSEFSFVGFGSVLRRDVCDEVVDEDVEELEASPIIELIENLHFLLLIFGLNVDDDFFSFSVNKRFKLSQTNLQFPRKNKMKLWLVNDFKNIISFDIIGKKALNFNCK